MVYLKINNKSQNKHAVLNALFLLGTNPIVEPESSILDDGERMPVLIHAGER